MKHPAIILAVILAAGFGAAPGFSGSTCVDGLTFDSRADLGSSDYFQAAGLRCGTPEPSAHFEWLGEGSGADCTLGSTTIDPQWDPGATYEIPVVVHIITNTSGTGNITDQVVQSQIDVLNEDFNAIAGTLGENGTFAGVQFVLATEDPLGNPTTGITRTANNTWYGDNDEQGFKTALNWDPNRYLNFYTNNTSFLGYAWFPQWGVGTWEDGIVVFWQSFGRNSPFPPYDLGRTATHETGHWLGLLHTFQGSCGTATPPQCYTTGDVVCDTNPDATSTFGCPGGSSCGFPIPVENYMEYTDDSCMELFTPEQVNRIRCSLLNYRPDVYHLPAIFTDGFESGNTTSWSSTTPP